MVLHPSAAPTHFRQGLVGGRWLCPLWGFPSKTGSSLQDRDGAHPVRQQRVWHTGTTEEVTGKQ